MILATIGAILIIAGVIAVVRKTAESWARRRAGILDERGEKPKVPYQAIVLVALGAVLMAIAGSWSP